MAGVQITNLRFDTLKEAHVERIIEIEKESNSAPWSDRSFKNEVTNSQSVFLVAFAGSKIVGFGGLWLCVDEAHITTVAVANDYRRNGIGREIMNQLLVRAQESGMTCSTLEVRANNEAAIALYHDLGYVETARRKGYYPDNQEDAVVT